MGIRIRIQCGAIRYLVDVTAVVQRTQEVGLELIHRDGSLLTFCSAFCPGLGAGVRNDRRDRASATQHEIARCNQGNTYSGTVWQARSSKIKGAKARW